MAHEAGFWWAAEKGEAHVRVFDHVSSVESAQSDIYERFLKLACLYDPNERLGLRGHFVYGPGPDSQVYENIVKSNVDTVAAIIARNKPRARFLTDDGDWSTQRTARQLELYAEGLVKQLEVNKKRQRVFKDAAIFGTGILKICADLDAKKIIVERVLVDEIIVDEGECRSGSPRHLSQRKFVDREVLKARYPDHEDAIDKAHTTGASIGSWTWADYRQLDRNQVVVIESWRLPIGEPGDDDYIPGRWLACVEGADLFDEEYDKPYFPFARIVWNERTTGWYGCGLAETIAGHQRALNKSNWQIDRQIDHHAVPTTYIKLADADLQVKTVNRLGTLATYRDAKPETVVPQSVSGEQFKRNADIKSSSFEESGVSRLAATAMKPAGIESAVAMREYKDTTTERFAMQEQADEQLFLDAVWLTVAAAKELGSDAPIVMRKARRGRRKLRWSDVDLGDVKAMIEAASSISRTPSGRTQTVIEWAQAGVISQDEARRLLQHPDLESAMSLYNASLEDIERCIEEMLDGEMLVPEPYQNLKMGLWRIQMAYLKARDDGAPEEVLENLRTWLTQAAHLMSMQTQAGAPPMGADAPPGPDAPPQSALAAQAMALQPA